MNKQHDIINKLIEQGTLTFNPFTLDINSPRYCVVISDTVNSNIGNDGIAPLISEILIAADRNALENLKPYHEHFKENIYVDIYAIDTFAEVTYELCFDNVKQLIEFKEWANVDSLIYYDSYTEEIVEI